MNMNDGFGMKGAFRGVLYQHARVLNALESGDPEELVWAMRQIKRGSMEGFHRTDEFAFGNTVVDEYRNRVLDLGWGGGTVISDVRMGLFSNDVTPGRTTTLANMSATITEFTNYTVDSGNTVNRASVTADAPSGQSQSNAGTPSRFTFTNTGTIYGAFVCLGAYLKDGSLDSTSPNILVAIGKLTAAQPISAAGAIIDMTYTQSNDT